MDCAVYSGRLAPMQTRAVAPFLAGLLAGCSVNPASLDVADTYFQLGGAVDVLFVVDDSNSMGETQAALAANAGLLFVGLTAEGVDWQIGVVTTDMDDPARRGRLVAPILTPADANPAASFAATVQVGTEGSQLERGLASAWSAITPPLTTHDNAGFIRPSARLTVVVVSDEDDCSDEGQLPTFQPSDCVSFPDRLVPASTYAARLRGLKDDPNAVAVHAVVETGTTAEFEGCGGNNNGSRYIELARGLGGLVREICGDPAALYDDLVEQLAGRRDAFPLSRTPDPLSISVTMAENVAPPEAGDPPPGALTGQSILEDLTHENGWSYDAASNSVRIWGSVVPPLGSAVQIRYSVATGG